ncbi:N-acetyltransferase, partial [Pseudoalteromonas sp. S2721]|uniref:GNAT family N-acetyltransferase n=1 Tax=Pseudoalteromonas sp. S2721 TaxID=579526 RepID=UPI00127B23D4
DVTKDIWRDVIKLEITKEQEDYVAVNSESNAESRLYYHYVNLAIYREDEVCRFIQFYDELDEGLTYEFYIAQFMVDVKYLGQGIGKNAPEIVSKEMNEIPECKTLTIVSMRAHERRIKFFSQCVYL